MAQEDKVDTFLMDLKKELAENASRLRGEGSVDIGPSVEFTARFGQIYKSSPQFKNSWDWLGDCWDSIGHGFEDVQGKPIAIARLEYPSVCLECLVAAGMSKDVAEEYRELFNIN